MTKKHKLITTAAWLGLTVVSGLLTSSAVPEFDWRLLVAFIAAYIAGSISPSTW